MAKIRFTNGEELEVTAEEGVKYIQQSNLSEVFGFSGVEDWIAKLAYYAGEKKFGKATKEMETLATDPKSLNDYLYEKGKLNEYQYNELKK